MSSLLQYNISFDDMKFLHGDFVKSNTWDSYIAEDGGISKDSQYMSFNSNGIEVSIGFELTVSGTHSFDPGDWETPPYSECEVDDVEICITDVYIDEYEVELTKDLTDILKKIIEKNL